MEHKKESEIEKGKRFKLLSNQELVEFFKDFKLNKNAVGLIPYPVNKLTKSNLIKSDNLLQQESEDAYKRGLLVVKVGEEVTWIKTGDIVKTTTSNPPNCVYAPYELPFYYLSIYNEHSVQMILPNDSTWKEEEAIVVHPQTN